MYDFNEFKRHMETGMGREYTDEEILRRPIAKQFDPATLPKPSAPSPAPDPLSPESIDDQLKTFASQYPDRDPAILREGYNEIKDRLIAKDPTWRGRPIKIDDLETLGKERVQKTSRGLFSSAASHLARGAVSAVGNIGQQLEMADLKPQVVDDQTGTMDEYGRKLTDWSKQKLDTSKFLQPDARERTGQVGFVERGVMGGLESMAQSTIPIAAAGAGFLVGGPVGAGIAGTAALASSFGLGTYGQKYEDTYNELKQKAPGRPEEEIRAVSKKNALINASLEVGTEWAQDALMFVTFGGSSVFTAPLKATIKNMLKKPVAELAKEGLKVVGGEVAGEMTAAGGQAWSDIQSGLESPGILKSMSEAIIPAITMATLFGSANAGVNRFNASQVTKALNSEKPEERLSAVQDMAGRIQANTGDKSLASVWTTYAVDAVKKGDKFNFNQPLVEFASSKMEEELAGEQQQAEPTPADIAITAATEALTNLETGKENQPDAAMGIPGMGDPPIDIPAPVIDEEVAQFDAAWKQTELAKQSKRAEELARFENTEKARAEKDYQIRSDRQAEIDAMGEDLDPPKIAEKKTYASRKAEEIKTLGYEDDDVSNMERHEVVSRVSYGVPKGVELKPVDGVLQPMEKETQAKRYAKKLNTADGGKRVPFKLESGKWGLIDPTTPAGKNVPKVMEGIKYSRLTPEQKAVKDQEAQAKLKQAVDNNARYLQKVEADKKAESDYEFHKKELLARDPNSPVLQQPQQSRKEHMEDMARSYQNLIANAKPSTPVVEKPIVINGKTFAPGVAPTEAPDITDIHKLTFPEFKQKVREWEAFHKEPNQQSDEDIQKSYDEISKQTADSIFDTPGNNTPDASAVPEVGTDSAPAGVASEKKDQLTGQKTIQYKEDTTLGDISNSWDDVLNREEAVREKNRPEIESLKTELAALPKTKDASSRKKEINARIDELDGEAGFIRGAGESAIQSAQEELSGKIEKRLEDEGITDEDTVRELSEGIQEHFYEARGREYLGPDWHKKTVKEITDNVIADYKKAQPTPPPSTATEPVQPEPGKAKANVLKLEDIVRSKKQEASGMAALKKATDDDNADMAKYIDGLSDELNLSDDERASNVEAILGATSRDHAEEILEGIASDLEVRAKRAKIKIVPGAKPGTPQPEPGKSQEAHSMTQSEYVQGKKDAAEKLYKKPIPEDHPQMQSWKDQYDTAILNTPKDTDIPIGVLESLPDKVRTQVLKGNEKATEAWDKEGPHVIWRMPYKELLKDKIRSRNSNFKGMHRYAIKKALSEGKPVPPEVLKDYPDLQAKPAEAKGEGGIYKRKVQLKDGTIKEMFGVPQPERLNPKKDGFGDSLFDTEAEAVAEYKLQRMREKEIEASRKAESEAESKKAEAKQKEDADDLNGFLKDADPRQKALHKKTLGKRYNFSDGGEMTVRERVEKLHADGKLETKTLTEPKIKPMSRRAYNQANNQEQEAHEKKMREAGNKTTYLVNDSELGKTAYDYANFLIGKVDKPAPQPAAKEAGGKSAPKPEETAKIEDFGEKIGGARKDVYAAYTDKMKTAKELDIATEPLSKTWPEPDYQKLIDDGADPWTVAFVRAARDEIPSKPKRRLQSWVDKVSSLRDFANDALAGKFTKEKNKAGIEKVSALLPFAGRIELYESFGHEISLKGVVLNQYHYAIYKGQENVMKWVVEQKTKATAWGNMPTELGVGDTKQEAIDSFKEKYETLKNKESQPRTVKFDFYTMRGKPGVFIGKKVGRNYIDLANFHDIKEARAYLAGNYDALVEKLNAKKQIPNERRDTNNDRVGADHRNGKAVTPDMFTDAFGFRGVEFGNWVNSQERQENLNRGYDALMDLATILHIPSKAISLNGEIGLAFGARGKGGKDAPSAHYESGKVAINLTKKNGPGSLAHEWFHALDNYFSRTRGNPSGYITDLPTRIRPDMDKTRQELLKAFDGVVAAIRATKLSERSTSLDMSRTKAYWGTGIEMAARSFESYVIEKMARTGESNDYLANIKSAKDYAGDMMKMLVMDQEGTAMDYYPYLLPEEVNSVTSAFDNLFDTIQTRETDKGVELYQRRQSPDDAAYLKAVEAGDMATAQKMVDARLSEVGAYWHGTPSGDLRGGVTGLHIGTKQAAMEALEARIGIPADGKGWTGDREYGKTLLAGKKRIRSGQFGKYRESGYNTDIPDEDFYPTIKKPTVVGDNVPVDFAWKPYIRPVLIVGKMSNTRGSAMSDSRANATMKGMLKKGSAKRGYFYINEGEDSGSVSAVLPNGEAVRVKLPDAVTYDDNGDVIPLSQRFNPENEDIRYQRRQDRAPLSGVTVKELRSLPFFKGKTITIKDGIVTVHLGEGRRLKIEGVVGAGGKVKYHLGLSSKGEPGAGMFLGNTVTLSQLADLGTVRHEIVHAAEEMGFLNDGEIRAINRAIRRETGKAVPDGVPGKEARANWMEKNMTDRAKYRETFIGRILQKLADLVDGIHGLFVVTGKGAMRAVESGKVFNRGQGKGPVFEFAQSPMMSPREAAKNVMENPKFVKWFGKSVVTDADGKPLVVYHGTRADITAFDPWKIGRIDAGYYGWGFYFTQDKGLASVYGEPMPVYLKMENPLVIYIDDSGSARTALQKELKKAKVSYPKEVTRELLERGYDGVLVKRHQDNSWGGKKGDIIEAVVLNDSWDTSRYDYEQNKSIPNTPKAAMSGTQIKSIYNSGEFSQTDPNILHQEKPITPEMRAKALREGMPLYQTVGYNMPQDIIDKLNAIHPNVEGYVSMKNDHIILHELQMPKDIRKTGLGTEFMGILTGYADSAGNTISLQAAGDYGGSKTGQQRFYRRHGFVPNKGRNKDYRISENMIRRPKGDTTTGKNPDSLSGSVVDFQERVTAAQDFADEVKSVGRRIKVNGDGSVALYHGTAESLRDTIYENGLQEQSFLSLTERETVEHIKQHNKTTVIRMNVDARDVSFSTGTQEVYAEKGLVLGLDGIWKSPSRLNSDTSASGQVREPLYQTKKLESTPALESEEGPALATIKNIALKLMDKDTIQEWEEKAMYHWVDSNHPARVIQRHLGITEEEFDYAAKESARGKIDTAKQDEFKREVMQPIYDKMAKYGKSEAMFNEYGEAMHTEEANERLELINSKQKIDRLIEVKTAAIAEMEENSPERAAAVKSRKEMVKAYETIKAEAEAEKAEIKAAQIVNDDVEDIDTKDTMIRYRDLLNSQQPASDKEKTFLDKWNYDRLRLAGQTNEEAAAILEKYKGDEAIEEIRRDLARVSESTLAMLREVGDISFYSDFKYYVPLYREGKDGSGMTTGRKSGPLGAPIQGRFGSTRDVVNVMAHIVANHQSAITRTLKLESGKVLYNLVKETQTPDNEIWWIEDSPTKPGYDKEGNVRRYTDMQEPKDGFFVRINGKRKLIRVNTDKLTMQRFLDSMKATSDPNPFVQFFGKINRALAMVNTSLSPPFMLTNLIKDAGMISVAIEDTDIKGMHKDLFKQYPSAMKGIWTALRKNSTEGWAGTFRDAERHGALVGWNSGYEKIEYLAKQIQKEIDLAGGKRKGLKTFRKVEQLIEHGNRMIESAGRVVVYKMMLEKGATKQQAGTIASGISVDFTKKGKYGPAMNAFYMFSTAGVGGSVKIIQMLAHSRKVWNITKGVMAAGFVMNILGMIMGGDDDDGMAYYDKLRETDPGVFERNIIIMTSDGQPIKIPMPWGFNAFYNLGHEISNASYKLATGGEYRVTEGASRIGSGFANAFNPLASATILQTILPTVLDPLAAIYENKMWHGGALMPGENPFAKFPRPDSERYFKSVSGPSKFIAQGLNKMTGGDAIKPGGIDVSPETLDLWYETITGAAGRFVRDVTLLPFNMDEKQPGQIPVIRSFYGANMERADSQFYNDRIKEVLTIKAQIKEGIKIKDTKRKLIPLADITEKKLRRLRKAKKKAEESGDNVKTIEERIAMAQKKFIKAYNDL